MVRLQIPNEHPNTEVIWIPYFYKNIFEYSYYIKWLLQSSAGSEW